MVKESDGESAYSSQWISILDSFKMIRCKAEVITGLVSQRIVSCMSESTSKILSKA